MYLRISLITVLLIAFTVQTYGQQAHLLLASQGDGALITNEKGDRVSLRQASYLPTNQLISVRPRSGLETLCAGYNFRYGSETKFFINEESIELNSGSILIKSRKIGNTISVVGPECGIKISGSGTCLIEVETSGGLKVVGVLGRFRLSDHENDQSIELMPGELSFLMPGGRGFGDRVNINLEKLIETSYLLSGFPNPKSFVDAMQKIASVQKESIGRSYNVKVGDSKSPDSFEIITDESGTEDTSEKLSTNEDLGNSDSYKVPEIDPLTELLGRAPRRFGDNVVVPISKENSEKLEDMTSNSEIEEVEEPVEDKDRPFPSRLLRQK